MTTILIYAALILLGVGLLWFRFRKPEKTKEQLQETVKRQQEQIEYMKCHHQAMAKAIGYYAFKDGQLKFYPVKLRAKKRVKDSKRTKKQENKNES